MLATVADPPQRRSPGSVARTGRTAPPRPFPWTNVRHQQLLVLVELDRFDDRLLDPQQGPP